MINHRSLRDVENIILNFVSHSTAKTGSDLPVASITKHLNENHNYTNYTIFLGYRSLIDKELITEDGKIANAFFNYIK